MRRLSVMVLGAGVAFAGMARGAEPVTPAAQMLADRLASDARNYSNGSDTSVESAAQTAAVLLQAAQQLNPGDLRILKSLAEAARVGGKRELEKETLRKIVGLDPGDLVAQVQFLDLVAESSQVMEDRARVYQAALGQPLDPQIRSEMALRLARIALERGDDLSARGYLQQAVGLNSVNVAALRELVRQWPANSTERVGALSNLLNVDPFEPAAWLEVARYLESAGVHDRAADFLVTVIEQMQLRGETIPGEVYLELGTERAIAGRDLDAVAVLYPLAKLPDAPLGALITAQLLSERRPPPPATQGAALPEAIEKRLVELAGQGTAASLADAIGTELTLMPNMGPETEKWLGQYAGLVTDDDATLARLRGWLLYRQGKVEEAAAILEPRKEGDPLAQLGMVRILMDKGNTVEAGSRLQKLWDANPTGLLALQILGMARKANVELTEGGASRKAREAVSKLTPALANAHRQTRDLQLVSVTYRRSTVGVGEPVVLAVRITNTSGRPLPVGPEGVVQTKVGLSAVFRNMQPPRALGLYAVEDLQRVYRLEPRAVIDGTVRVDEGLLGTIASQNPTLGLGFGVWLTTAPRGVENSSKVREAAPGLGGLQVSAGDLERAAYSVGTEADFQKLLTEIGTFSGEKQLIRMEVAMALLGSSTAKPYRDRLIEVLRPLTGSAQPVVRAFLLRGLPSDELGAEMDKAVEAMAGDPDPLVRLMWCGNEGTMAQVDDERGRRALGLLKQKREVETDPLVKEWIGLILTGLHPTAPGTKPGTKPATAPTTGRDGRGG